MMNELNTLSFTRNSKHRSHVNHFTTTFTKDKKKEEEENPPYLLPSALCYHVTAGNSKEEHHKPNLKERGRQTESTKGGSESTLGASEEAIFSHKDQSITKKPSEVERESPLNRFSSFQLSWTHQHNTIVY